MRRRLLPITIVVLALCNLITPASATHETDSRFLDTVPAVDSDGYWEEATAEVNGELLPHSILNGDVECDWINGPDGPQSISFNLGREWQEFSATLGLDDQSDENLRVLIEMYLDGQLMHSEDYGLGESDTVIMDVAGVLRLKLVVTPIGNECEDASEDWHAMPVFGNATLSRPLAHQHERTVSLSLAKGLRVSGKVTVPDGTDVCAGSMRVIIQRHDYGWEKVGEASTASNGTFSTTLRNRKGKYRAVALKTEVGATYPEHLCLKARSKSATI